ncbi:hypothetical protein G6F59_018165 [Rhizopus arrhizus]|nr:hypothetical protein G6F59_018165 [Rhizopus arrhizus]
MRIIQPVHGAHAVQQVVGHAVHDLADVAVDVGVQPAEVRAACRRAHAAQEAVAFHQQYAGAIAGGAGGSQPAGRAAAQHHDLLAIGGRGFALFLVSTRL